MFVDVKKQEKIEKLEVCIETLRQRFGKEIIKNAVLLQQLPLPTSKVELTMPTGMVG